MAKDKWVDLPQTITGNVVDFPDTYAGKVGNAKGRRPHRSKLQSAPFVGWDGEGYTDDNGTHHYMLFGNSNGDHVTGTSLTWRECFPLLLDSADNINVIFSGDYDIIMMTRTLPFTVRDRLLHGKPVKYGGYRMVYRRRKMFFLKDLKSNRSMVLYDMFSFFQCSFVKACVEYLGDDETLQEMHRMKLQRNTFKLGDESIVPYWTSELDYLVQLANTLRELLADVGIKPRGWYGPGAVANALLNREGMKAYYAPIPDEIVDIAERAYYGGRFEQFRVGKLDDVYEYDIRSAYPAAIAQLPDFTEARWEHIVYEEGEYPKTYNSYALYKVSWHVPSLGIHPFPWRADDGHIYYPRTGYESWYWGVEVYECLRKSFPKDMYTVHECWHPHLPNKVRMPFRSWVPQMYEDRARMKREGNPAQKALKLGLNSLYGKLAQSTGTQFNDDGTYRKPAWHNILWAGWVTAATRARLYDAIRRQAPKVIAMETDAIFTTHPIPGLELSEKLGEWEETHFGKVLYIHSGIYYAMTDEGLWRTKSRGLEVDKTRSADYWLEIFSRLPHENVEITNRFPRFGSDVRQKATYGKWYEYETSTTFPLPKSLSKRLHHPKGCLVCIARDTLTYADHAHFLSVPQGAIQSDWQSSTPYNFVWRKDVSYEWPSIIRSEAIELPEEVTWEWDNE